MHATINKFTFAHGISIIYLMQVRSIIQNNTYNINKNPLVVTSGQHYTSIMLQNVCQLLAKIINNLLLLPILQ